MNGFRISCSPLWKKELFGCLWIFKESSETPKIHNPIRNIGFWRVVFYCDFFGLKPSNGTWLRITKRGRIVWRRVLFAHSVRLHEKADAFLEPDKSTSQNKTGENFWWCIGNGIELSTDNDWQQRENEQTTNALFVRLNKKASNGKQALWILNG